MDSALTTYEAEIRKLIETDGPERMRMTPADQEREKAYGLAATLNSHFDEMLQQLSSMVEDINSTFRPTDESGANGTTGDTTTEDGGAGQEQSAYAQVVRILNHHLSSLRWLDSQVSQLDRRTNEIERYRSAAESVVSRIYNTSRESSAGISGAGLPSSVGGMTTAGVATGSGTNDWASLRGK